MGFEGEWKEAWEQAITYLMRHAITLLQKVGVEYGSRSLQKSYVDQLPQVMQYFVEFFYEGYDDEAICPRCWRLKGYAKGDPDEAGMKEIKRMAKCVNCLVSHAPATQGYSRPNIQVKNGKGFPCIWNPKECSHVFTSHTHVLYHYHQRHWESGRHHMPKHIQVLGISVHDLKKAVVELQSKTPKPYKIK